MEETLDRSRLETPVGVLELVASAAGLLFLGLGPDAPAKTARWIARVAPSARLRAAEGRNAPYERQLREYFDGRRRVFDVPLDLRGTDFQKAVWRAVAEIPYGRTASYRDVAHLVGRPLAVRAVGAANGANPIPILVPCHRVVGADGSLTGYGGGLPIKRWLLAHEGVLRSGAVQMGLFREGPRPGA